MAGDLPINLHMTSICGTLEESAQLAKEQERVRQESLRGDRLGLPGALLRVLAGKSITEYTYLYIYLSTHFRLSLHFAKLLRRRLSR